MKFKFEVTYIPNLLKKVNNDISEFDLDFGKVAIVQTITISNDKLKEAEDVKKDLILVFEQNGNTVVKIEGGTFC